MTKSDIYCVLRNLHLRPRPSRLRKRGFWGSASAPAGEHLTKARARSNHHGDIHHYRNLSACQSCVLRPRCTTEYVKRVKRWKHEAVIDAMQKRLDRLPNAIGIRRRTVEHVFGTRKSWMGSTHFLTKTLKSRPTI